jgi:archaellum component FlaC
MKMKKLLSIGAFALVLVCSTSIGASAATIPSNADIIKIILNQYKNGTNPVGVLSEVNKDTKIGTILTPTVTEEIDSQLSNHPSVDKLLTKVENNQDNSIATILEKVTADEATFSKFQAKFIEIAEKVKAMDTKMGIERILAEQKISDIVTAYDATLNVTFGKNCKGKTTASIEKNGHVLVQLNSDNLQTIIDRVRNLTWTEVSIAKALL